jgi:ureidoglycolate hydrolase
MSISNHQVKAAPLTLQAWEPFGWLPVPDVDAAAGHHRLEFEWHDVHVNLIAHHLEEITRSGVLLRCDQMFHHWTHTQALLVLNCDAVIAVAPAAVTFAEMMDLLEIKAFTLKPLQSLVLSRGTWHWGPFPLDSPTVQLYNVQGFRYAEDNESYSFLDHSTVVDINVG